MQITLSPILQRWKFKSVCYLWGPVLPITHRIAIKFRREALPSKVMHLTLFRKPFCAIIFIFAPFSPSHFTHRRPLITFVKLPPPRGAPYSWTHLVWKFTTHVCKLLAQSPSVTSCDGNFRDRTLRLSSVQYWWASQGTLCGGQLPCYWAAGKVIGEGSVLYHLGGSTNLTSA